MLFSGRRDEASATDSIEEKTEFLLGGFFVSYHIRFCNSAVVFISFCFPLCKLAYLVHKQCGQDGRLIYEKPLDRSKLDMSK